MGIFFTFIDSGESSVHFRSKSILMIHLFIFYILINGSSVLAINNEAVFPLKIGSNSRYLIDQKGRPFLLNADAGWEVFNQLKLEEVEEYFKARKAQGFNTIQTQLCRYDRGNVYGEVPFPNNQDFTQPNEKFFEHADRVFKKAEEMNLFLAVSPLWLGCCGGDWGGRSQNGIPRPIKANGPDKCREFGRWLGKRYAKFKHVMWIIGGDANPNDDREEYRQLALGIKETAKHHFLTYHAASTLSSMDVWKNEDTWIDIVMVYTYFGGKMGTWTPHHPEVYQVSIKEYNRYPGPRPFFLGESQYEGGSGNDNGTDAQARRQSYWAMLGGAMGHCYGSPLYSFKTDWRNYLNLPGANQLKYFYELFSSRNWYDLVPDQENQLLISGEGSYGSPLYIAAAKSIDNRLALIYVPPGSSINRRFKVDLSDLVGTVRARWFDPTDGTYRNIDSSPFKTKGIQDFIAPGKNRAGETDFVLVLESL
jgi:hypothetical protein